MRKAIVLVSFGSSNLEGIKNTIYLLEEELRAFFSNVTVVTAFSSNRIISLLKEKHDVYVKRLDQCLFDLANDQYEEIIIQPLNIIEEALNREIEKTIEEYRYSFKRIVMANSILAGNGEALKERCNMLAECIIDKSLFKPVLLIGHGSKTNSNECYGVLRESFQEISGRETFIATVEGDVTISDAIGEMNKNDVKDILLQPLFLTSGKHLNKDVFGAEDSIVNVLDTLGFNIAIENKALLQYKSVREIYTNNLKSLFSSK